MSPCSNKLYTVFLDVQTSVSSVSRSVCSLKHNLGCDVAINVALERAFANLTEITSQENICRNQKFLKRLLLRVLTDLLFNQTDVAHGCEIVEMAIEDLRKWNESWRSLLPEILRNILQIKVFRSEVLKFLIIFDLEVETFAHAVSG